MNVLIDLNIVLDVILRRQPWVAEADVIWDANLQGRLRGHLVATSLTNLFYITRRILGADEARRAVRNCLQCFRILPVDGAMLQQADAWPGADFEDNLQLVAAAAVPLDAIVTRDPSGFAGSPVPVLAPAGLIAKLPDGSS